MSLNWAVGEHSDKALEPRLQDPLTRKIVWLDIEQLLAYMRQRRGFVVNHAHLVKEHWESGGWVDPSDIRGYSQKGDLLVEGKNRLIAALELGETHSPFSVPLEILDDFLEKYNSIV